MAFARSLSTRATILARRRQPCFSYILHDDNRKNQSPEEPESRVTDNSFAQHRSFYSGVSGVIQDGRCSPFSLLGRNGFSSSRYMSTTAGDGSDKVELIGNITEVLRDSTMEAVASQAPVLNEVAIAAADNWYPVAALQHFIDQVHTFTGLNWWASIALTTAIIRVFMVPLLISQMKSSVKLAQMKPHLEEIKARMDARSSDPTAVHEGQKEMNKLFKEYGVTPWSPLKGAFVQGPVFISFFLGIKNMAEKVPSFKDGGVFWFTDLSTPDSMLLLPILTGLTFWITVELNTQQGMEGNTGSSTMKNVSRGLAVLTVPFTSTFPKAIFCYWITSNLFSLVYGLVLKAPGVKKALNIPDMPVPPPNSNEKPFDLFSAIKNAKNMFNQAETAASAQASASLPVQSQSPKAPDQKIPPYLLTSQRLRTLQKQNKKKNKNKRK